MSRYRYDIDIWQVFENVCNFMFFYLSGIIIVKKVEVRKVSIF